MELSSVDDLKAVKFSQQGDASMYTAEAMDQRFRNRTNPRIVETINQLWWRAANVEDLVYDPDASLKQSESWKISKTEYIHMATRQIKALLEEGEEWDPVEAEKIAEEAWKEDSRGKDYLSKTRFVDSIFELAGTNCLFVLSCNSHRRCSYSHSRSRDCIFLGRYVHAYD